MLAILGRAKGAFERITGCRIYRHSMPHGTVWCFDIDRRFGREGFKVVFDVGANVGQSALSYLEEFPRAEIFSFEPVAATYQELAAATSRFPRVHPFNLGMGRAAGQMLINVNPISRMSSIKLSRPEDHSETIELETIAGFCKKHHVENIDFLKIDTEGFDLEVLTGAIPLLEQQRVHLIQCECEPVLRTKQFASFSDLAEFLAGFGYRVFGVYEQQPEWDGRNMLLYWNAIFICEKLIGKGSRLT
jgi:FkbM family methyltransferase